jgi:hypothetical protein
MQPVTPVYGNESLPVETLIAASPREASRGKPRLYRWIYS